MNTELTFEQKLILEVVESNIKRLEALVANKSALADLYLSWYQKYSFESPALDTGYYKNLVRAALEDVDTYPATGSWNAEITRCSGCDRTADGWGMPVTHKEDCPYPKKMAAIEELRKWVDTPNLKVYHGSFSGHWLGGEAVMVAANPQDAAYMLNENIESMGLTSKQDEPMKPENMHQIDLAVAGITILDDGNY